MNLLQKTKQLCISQKIKPARSKGQNFLILEEVYQKVIKAADLNKNDIVLEVGPGLGFLTEMLAERVKKVIAIELDDKLAEALEARLEERGIKNVEVINDDILKLSPKSKVQSPKQTQNTKYQIPNTRYKVVANLPYNITSRFLRKFLEEIENKPEEMVLMLQKEVAERIIAKPGEMSILAVAVQFYCDAQIIASAPAEAFWPKPKIDSAIIKLKVKSKKLKVREDKFFKLVRAGFSAKRKMLKNNLVKNLDVKSEIITNALKKIGLDEKARAQELSVEQWCGLYIVLDRQNML